MVFLGGASESHRGEAAVIAHRLTLEAPPSVEAALFVHASPVGAHVGVLYRVTDGGGFRLLHQAWHCDSRDDDLAEYLQSPDALLWVVPGLDEDEQEDLRTHARLVSQRVREKSIPYAFRPQNASFGADGSVSLGESLGLTCATFVIRLCDAARVKLVNEVSWNSGRSAERANEDMAVHEKLVNLLAASSKPETRKHAASVKSEIEAPRIRAEEVAAASGFKVRPVSYAMAGPAGSQLLAQIQKLKAASLIEPLAADAKTAGNQAERSHKAASARVAALEPREGPSDTPTHPPLVRS